MNMNSKIIIKNLYKESLKTVHELGYRYGSLTRINRKNWICKEKILTRRRFRRLYSSNELGTFLAANVKIQYEMGKEVHNEKSVEMLIDEGFLALRSLNFLVWYIKEIEQEENAKKNQK